MKTHWLLPILLIAGCSHGDMKPESVETSGEPKIKSVKIVFMMCKDVHGTPTNCKPMVAESKSMLECARQVKDANVFAYCDLEIENEPSGVQRWMDENGIK